MEMQYVEMQRFSEECRAVYKMIHNVHNNICAKIIMQDTEFNFAWRFRVTIGCYMQYYYRCNSYVKQNLTESQKSAL